MTRQPVGILLQDSLHYPYAIAWAFVTKPKHYHAMMCSTVTKDQFAKILVVRNEDSPFAHSPGEDIHILGLGHRFSNSKHVMADTA
jgi:hypothetical protein